MAYKYDVFISYSHADKVWVRDVLLEELEKEDSESASTSEILRQEPSALKRWKER